MTPKDLLPLGRQLNLSQLNIRWMIRVDLQQVELIESGAFANPWTEQEFLEALRCRNTSAYVATVGRGIVGYAICRREAGAICLDNIAVDPDFSRQGIGSALIKDLVRRSAKRHRIVAIVRDSNLPAQMFLRSQNFRSVAMLRGHYEDSDEDALMFRLSIQQEGGVS